MIRNILFILILSVNTLVVAQKPQKIAYVDMEYILENVPEYTDAQDRLKTKVITWQQRLDALKREIEVMKVDLSNEKALLTNDLIDEREEDIQIKELDLTNLQAGYFGPNGDLFALRKQMVKPVQDQVYSAIQEIAVQKQYDMVLDKSTDLIMLYSNNKFDISELVLNKIVKGRRIQAVEERKEERIADNLEKIEEAKEKAEDKATKNEALRARIKAQNEARAQKRAELKKAAEEKRKKRLEEIEKRKKEREEKLKKTTEKSKDSIKQ
tara:strand:+ start:453307 stop:454110 length:804 start_codon:yes stop_codon:yes gene_type:complete